jgi:uncharacterized membrane protein YsdA (DUF1294 family)
MQTADKDLLIASWLALMSGWAVLLFGYDKWQARRGGARVSEANLWLVSAFGGWLGGLLGIILFRHKSTKGSFQLKFIVALAIWFTLLRAAWQWRTM